MSEPAFTVGQFGSIFEVTREDGAVITTPSGERLVLADPKDRARALELGYEVDDD